MSMMKPTLVAAGIALAGAIGIPALAQQTAPKLPPTAEQAQQQPADADQSYGDDQGPRRWQRGPEGPGPRFGENRWRRGPEGRDRMAQRGNRMGRGFAAMRVCGPRGEGAADRMMARIERVTKPTDQQKAAFDKLKEAASKAAATMRAACPTERTLTPTGRLAATEKRLAARLDAVRTVRPAMDAFYATLSDEQKARLNMPRRPMHRFGMNEQWRGSPDRDRGPGRPDRPRRWGDLGQDQGEQLTGDTPSDANPWVEQL